MIAPTLIPKRTILAGAIVLCSFALAIAQSDPWASWTETRSKKAIITFVDRVTKERSPDFVAVPERIAVFDNDGTLWAERQCISRCSLYLTG